MLDFKQPELYKKYQLDKIRTLYYLLNKKGELSHPDLPSIIETIKTSEETEEVEHIYYYLDGILYHPIKPAYQENAITSLESYKFWHTLKILKKDHKKITENFFLENYVSGLIVNSEVHRLSGPAKIKTQKFYDSEKNTYFYLQKDKLHRDDSPAIIFFDEDHKIQYSEWYIEGKKIR